MRITIYPKYGGTPVLTRKFVRNIIEAQSFCEWWKRTKGQEVTFAICR